MAVTEYGKHMGELKRGEHRWDVYLEGQPDTSLGAVRGRIHFVSGQLHKVTGWIFLEWQGRMFRSGSGSFRRSSYCTSSRRCNAPAAHSGEQFAHFHTANSWLGDFFCSLCTDFLTSPSSPSTFPYGPPLAKRFTDSGRRLKPNDSNAGTHRRHRRESVHRHVAGGCDPSRQGSRSTGRGRAVHRPARHLAALLDSV